MLSTTLSSFNLRFFLLIIKLAEETFNAYLKVLFLRFVHLQLDADNAELYR